MGVPCAGAQKMQQWSAGANGREAEGGDCPYAFEFTVPFRPTECSILGHMGMGVYRFARHT